MVHSAMRAVFQGAERPWVGQGRMEAFSTGEASVEGALADWTEVD